MLIVLIENDPFLGRLLTGRIESGKAVPGMAIHALDRDGKEIERGRITKVLAFRGLKRQPVDEAPKPATSSPSPACPRPPWPTPCAPWKSPRPCPPSRSTRRPSP